MLHKFFIFNFHSFKYLYYSYIRILITQFYYWMYYILHFDDQKYQLLANKMIKILVVLATKIVALFWQIQISELILALLCIVNIYLFGAYQFSLCCFEGFSTTLAFHEFSQRLYLDKCFNNLVNIWFNNKQDNFNTYFYAYIKAYLYIFVKRSSLSQEFVTKFSSILF